MAYTLQLESTHNWAQKQNTIDTAHQKQLYA